MIKTKLLVNNPHGKQEIVEIGPTGSYSLPENVLWDERTDGPLPENIVIGAMMRDGAELAVDNEKRLEIEMAKTEEAERESLEAQKRTEKYNRFLSISEKMKAKSASLEEIQEFLLIMHGIGESKDGNKV